MSRLFAAIVLVLMGVAMSGCEKSQPTPAPGATAGEETPAQMKAGIEGKHPATYYMLAGRLFKDGDKDEAVFWFYLGQLRYRFHLAVATNLDPSGDPALFGSLSEVVGRPLNEYAF